MRVAHSLVRMANRHSWGGDVSRLTAELAPSAGGRRTGREPRQTTSRLAFALAERSSLGLCLLAPGSVLPVRPMYMIAAMK